MAESRISTARTAFHDSFFLLRTAVQFDGKLASVEETSDESDLKLSLTREEKKHSASFPSISGKIEDGLKRFGLGRVTNFFCEKVPLFQVNFLSADNLEIFLLSADEVKKQLTGVFSAAMNDESGGVNCDVEAELFFVRPFSEGVRGVIPLVTAVGLENCRDFLNIWKDSAVFDFGEALDTADPERRPKIEVTPDRAMEGLFRLSNWHGLGIQLNMQPHELAKIKEDFQTVNRCRDEMLNSYIKKRNASWFSIVRGLLHISEYALANDLAYKYGITLPFESLEQVCSTDGSRHLMKEVQRKYTLAQVGMDETKNKYITTLDQLVKAKEELRVLDRERAELVKERDVLQGTCHSLEQCTNVAAEALEEEVRRLKMEILAKDEQIQAKDDEIKLLNEKLEDIKSKLLTTKEQLEAEIKKVRGLQREKDKQSAKLYCHQIHSKNKTQLENIRNALQEEVLEKMSALMSNQNVARLEAKLEYSPFPDNMHIWLELQDAKDQRFEEQTALQCVEIKLEAVKILEKGYPDPSQCKFERYGDTKQANFEVHLLNKALQPCTAREGITVTATLSNGSTVTNLPVTFTGMATCDISYAPTTFGMHQIHVRVDNKDIQDSPLNVTIRGTDSGKPWTVHFAGPVHRTVQLNSKEATVSKARQLFGSSHGMAADDIGRCEFQAGESLHDNATVWFAPSSGNELYPPLTKKQT